MSVVMEYMGGGSLQARWSEEGGRECMGGGSL